MRTLEMERYEGRQVGRLLATQPWRGVLEHGVGAASAR